jgi:cytochrome c biogenesis protein
MMTWLTEGLRRLASLWLTLALLAGAAFILGHSRLTDQPVGAVIAVPLGGLCLNLLAALATNRRLRRQPGLLVFHLSLAVLVLLAAVGRLVAMTGNVEVIEGGPFDPAAVRAAAAPLHPWRLDKVDFVQGRFTVDYAPGMKRRQTVSTVHVPDGQGGRRTVQIGDDTPLVVGGYRFYTTFNKGFAVLLTFTDRAGREENGAIHFPSYPLNDGNQANRLMPPGATESLSLWLRIVDAVYDENAAWQFRRPGNAVLVVNDGSRRHELRVGETTEMAGGRLRFDELRTWMGYAIFYDPLTPWMLAAAMVAVAGLAWHLAVKFMATPWHAEESRQGVA